MKIKSESSYSDGHESVKFYEVDEDEVRYALLDGVDALWDVLHTYSGDGHGIDNDLGFFHVVTIVEANNPLLVGEFIEVDG